MKTDTSKRIIEYVQQKVEVSASELADYLNLTPRAIFKQLKSLIEKKQLSKIGKPPKVFYTLYRSEQKKEKYIVDSEIRETIDKHFMTITAGGIAIEGFEGFVYWCNKFKLNVIKTAHEYEKTLKKYTAHKTKGLIDGMGKMKGTFAKVYLNKLFYLDFYAIERFGKTKLGQYLLYAKQSQNRQQIAMLIKSIRLQIQNLISDYNIDGVGYIPPTVKREVQLMREMQKKLQLKPKILSIVKVKTPIIVPQKTLNKLSDRIENSQQTIVVNETNTFNNILLIDDAVGSGATINETAAQIRKKGICKGKIIALAITGSFKGFDIISEV